MVYGEGKNSIIVHHNGSEIDFPAFLIRKEIIFPQI